MIKNLLVVRLKQISRGLVGIGFIRLIFLIGLTGFVGLGLFVKSSDALLSQFIILGFLLILTLVQLYRSDKLFLKSNFKNFKLLILSEYFILSTPILFCLSFHQHWILLVGLLLGVWIIVNLDYKVKVRSLNTKLQNLIPSDCFEWKAGVRKRFFVIVPIWIVAASSSFLVGSVPVAIFILGILILSFYDKSESLEILQIPELGSARFLFHKIKRQILLFSIVVFPLIVLFVLFNTDEWYIPVIEYIIFSILGGYIIFVKYAFYQPNIKSSAAQLIGGFGILGGIIPVFLPVVMVLAVWFYLKAIVNLNYYLDDYNK